MIWGPRGVIDSERANLALDWLEAAEPSLGAFNRLVDLSQITGVHLRREEIAAIAERRRERYAGESVTTVFLAGDALGYGVARMYEHLMTGSPIRVEVVALLTSAARILDVPADVLLQNAVTIEP